MTTTLLFAIAFATLMLVVAVMNKLGARRLLVEMNGVKAKLEESKKENELLKEKITSITKKGGISEASVLSLIGDISRIDNNLYHMQDVPGRKQISKALDRMKVTLQAEDYTIVPLIGTSYKEGMLVSAVFVPDESLPFGESVITSVQKPQVNRAGKMIQAASVIVGQNV